MDELLKKWKIVISNANKSAKHKWTAQRIEKYQGYEKKYREQLENILKNKPGLNLIFAIQIADFNRTSGELIELLSRVQVSEKEVTGSAGSSKQKETEQTESESESLDNFQQEREKQEENEEEEYREQNKMAAFDLKTANSIIPDFAGGDAMEDFLDAIELYEGTLNAEGKIKNLQFVLKIKLKGAAKIKMKIVAEPTTFEDFKKEITARFGKKESMSAVSRKIFELKQGTMSATKFAEKIEQLTNDLTNMQITHQGDEARDVLTKTNNLNALNAFTMGLNGHLRPVVLASRVKTLEEAVALAIEAEVPLQSCSKSGDENPLAYNINYTRYGGRGNFRGKFGNYRGNSGNFGNNFNNHGSPRFYKNYNTRYVQRGGGNNSYRGGRQNYEYRENHRQNDKYQLNQKRNYSNANNPSTSGDARQQRVYKVEKNSMHPGGSTPLGEFQEFLV